MKYREIAKKLRNLGCEELIRKGGGSHRKWYNPNRSPIIVVAVPDWGSKDLKTGTEHREGPWLGMGRIHEGIRLRLQRSSNVPSFARIG